MLRTVFVERVQSFELAEITKFEKIKFLASHFHMKMKMIRRRILSKLKVKGKIIVENFTLIRSADF